MEGGWEGAEGYLCSSEPGLGGLPSQCPMVCLVGHGIPGTEGRLAGEFGSGLLSGVAGSELMSGVGHTGGHR